MWKRKKKLKKTAAADKAILKISIIAKEISTAKVMPSALHCYSRIGAPRPYRWKTPCCKNKNSFERKEPKLKGFSCKNNCLGKCFFQSQNTQTQRGCCNRSPRRPGSILGSIVHIVLQAWRCKLRWSWSLNHNFRELLRQGNVWILQWDSEEPLWEAVKVIWSYNNDSRMLEIPESRNTLI